MSYSTRAPVSRLRDVGILVIASVLSSASYWLYRELGGTLFLLPHMLSVTFWCSIAAFVIYWIKDGQRNPLSRPDEECGILQTAERRQTWTSKST